MLHTIKQQCHKPTDLQVILKDRNIPLLFAVGLVGRRFPGFTLGTQQFWSLALLAPAAWWKSEVVHAWDHHL